RVAASHSRESVRRLLSLMVGELNASHLGVRSPGSAKRTTGRLGLRFDRNECERNGRFLVTEVVTLSPADVTRKIHKGDYLAAVDGIDLTRATNLERLLEYKTGKEVRLTLADAAGTRRDVTVRPVTSPPRSSSPTATGSTPTANTSAGPATGASATCT
ncbi:MAG: peptidase, partial [Acidobacteria bacterium]|nr:peptidase [Acidobacteriota bacterium]